jgi:hypothetical protein
MSDDNIHSYIENAGPEVIEALQATLQSGSTFLRAIVVDPGTSVDPYRFRRGLRAGYHEVMSLAYDAKTCLLELGLVPGGVQIPADKVLAFQIYSLNQDVPAYDVSPLQQLQNNIYEQVLEADGENRRHASIVFSSGLSTNPNSAGAGVLPIKHPSVSGIKAGVFAECVQYPAKYHEANKTALTMDAIVVMPKDIDLNNPPDPRSLPPLPGTTIPL